MKKIIELKLGVSLLTITFSMLGGINQAIAQTCTTPPSCDTLGYKQSASDCSGQQVLKCPFDNSKVFCGGVAQISSNCTIGDILFSDNSCSSIPLSNKTPIGVVFDSTKRLAIALNTGGKTWSLEKFDIPNLTTHSSLKSALADWAGQANTKTILEYCKANSKSCPAAEYVNSYTTAGTRAGDWYLPALGEINEMDRNLDKLNISLKRVGGTTLLPAYHWSSSESSYISAMYLDFSNGGVYAGSFGKDSNCAVRPVLAF